jgi:CheY-like chemotaxis protein
MAEKILVVDDNEDVTRITTKVLSSRGYDVLAASSGVRALELARREHPDCILLDVMMPEMSGLDVLGELKKSPDTARIPVILITARIRDEDVLEGYKEGADYYITKPFSTDQLIYGVRLVLGQAGATETRAPEE